MNKDKKCSCIKKKIWWRGWLLQKYWNTQAHTLLGWRDFLVTWIHHRDLTDCTCKGLHKLVTYTFPCSWIFTASTIFFIKHPVFWSIMHLLVTKILPWRTYWREQSTYHGMERNAEQCSGLVKQTGELWVWIGNFSKLINQYKMYFLFFWVPVRLR